MNICRLQSQHKRNGQSAVEVNEEMAAHMERLFAQAEQTLQETAPA